MVDLLCCPFCGSDAFVLSREHRHWVYCKNDECGAETQGKTTHSDAVTAWNTCSALSDAVAEREAEPVAVVVGHHVVQGPNVGFLTGNLDVGTKLYVSPSTSELEALRKRVAELEKALEPFAATADETDEHDADSNHIWEHHTAMNISIGDLRTARRVREGGKAE